MVKGIGIDVIEIERIERALRRRKGFMRRLFTPWEIAYCSSRPRPGASFAARFAAKEAVRKACTQVGVKGTLRWREIEVRNGERGPEIFLQGKTADLVFGHGIACFFVSLSHSRDYACAVVVAV